MPIEETSDEEDEDYNDDVKSLKSDGESIVSDIEDIDDDLRECCKTVKITARRLNVQKLMAQNVQVDKSLDGFKKYFSVSSAFIC